VSRLGCFNRCPDNRPRTCAPRINAPPPGHVPHGLVTTPDNRPSPLKSKAAGRSQAFNVFRGPFAPVPRGIYHPTTMTLFPPPHFFTPAPSKKFRQNPFTTFSVIRRTNRQTDKQTEVIRGGGRLSGMVTKPGGTCTGALVQGANVLPSF